MEQGNKAIAVLLMGAGSFVLVWFPFIWGLAAPIAVAGGILGILILRGAEASKQERKMAAWGIVLCAGTILLAIITLIGVIQAWIDFEEELRKFEEELRKQFRRTR